MSNLMIRYQDQIEELKHYSNKHEGEINKLYIQFDEEQKMGKYAIDELRTSVLINDLKNKIYNFDSVIILRVIITVLLINLIYNNELMSIIALVSLILLILNLIVFAMDICIYIENKKELKKLLEEEK